MTCSGMREHLFIPQKYPALNKTIEVTTIFLRADWNWVSSEEFLNWASVIPNMSSIQTTKGMPRDLKYIATASEIE